jgi:hypothetical protein
MLSLLDTRFGGDAQVPLIPHLAMPTFSELHTDRINENVTLNAYASRDSRYWRFCRHREFVG